MRYLPLDKPFILILLNVFQLVCRIDLCMCAINIYMLNIHIKSSENYWVTKFNV